MDYDQQDGFLGWARRHPRWADVVCLLAIVLFALFLRLVYVAEYTMSPLGITAVGSDVAAHDTAARQILAGEITGAPLYPRFLAMLYRQTGGALGAVRNLKLLVDTAALAMVWIAVRRLWRRRAACLLGLLWSAYLPLIYYSAELHPEGLAVFFLSLAFFIWSLIPQTGRFRVVPFPLIGLCLGLASAAQPLILPFAVAAAFLAPYCLPGEMARRDRLVAALACLVPGLLLLFSPLSPFQTGNAFGLAPSPLHNLLHAWSAHEIPSGSDLPELQFFTPLMRWPFPRFGWIAPLAVLGAWLCRRDRRAWLWMLLPVIYTVALTATAPAGGRQRLPMIPALLVLAALGLDALAGAWQKRDIPTWRLATAVLLGAFAAIHLIRPPAIPDSAARSWLLIAEASHRVGDLDHATQALDKAAELAPGLPGIASLRERCPAQVEGPDNDAPPAEMPPEAP
jgi:hypothetical protein